MFLDPSLAALTAVLRTGSFEAAAAQLSVTPSAISQRIKALEDRVGTVLVIRGSPCSGTAAGVRLMRHADQVALLETTLDRDLRAATGPATVRLAVNADSLATWFLPALAGTEGVLADLKIDDQDHSADWLRRGEVLAAVTAHDRAVQGCDIYPLGALRYRATASPAFLARHFPDGVQEAALACAPMLTFDLKDRLQASWIRSVFDKTAQPPTHLLPSTHAFVEAACLGLGWGMNPEPLVAEHLRAGRLVELMPDRPLDTPLYWQVSRLTGSALADLTAAVRREAAAGLVPTG